MILLMKRLRMKRSSTLGSLGKRIMAAKVSLTRKEGIKETLIQLLSLEMEMAFILIPMHFSSTKEAGLTERSMDREYC